MAKLHSGKRGRSGSSKPLHSTASAWMKATSDDVIAIVEKLSKEGKTPAQIGEILRDQHGVPSIKLATGKSMAQVLKDKGLVKGFPQDLLDLIRKSVRVHKHLKANRKDIGNRVKLKHMESKILRLSKYYKLNGRIPRTWKYDPETAALLVK